MKNFNALIEMKGNLKNRFVIIIKTTFCNVMPWEKSLNICFTICALLPDVV